MPRLLVAVMAALALGSAAAVAATNMAGKDRASRNARRTHSFTLAGWVGPAVPGGVLLAAIVNLDRRDGLSLLPDRRVRFRMSAAGRRIEVVAPSPLPDGGPSHVAVIADPSGIDPGLVLYVEGREVARAEFSGTRGAVAFRIARRQYAARLYRRALGPDDIRALAGPAPSPPAPDVVSIGPAPDAVRVPVHVQPLITFSGPIDPALVSTQSVTLTDAGGAMVPAQRVLDEARVTLRISPDEPLLPMRWYSVTAFGVTSRFMTGSEPRRVAVGEAHAVALDAAGGVWTWGVNTHGQLGRPEAGHSPALVAGLPVITTVAAGAWHTLALAADGRLFAWGNNALGQLGTGDPASTSAVPALVAGVPPLATVTAGLFGSAAIDVDGHVWVWGLVQGLGPSAPHRLPVQVDGLAGAAAVAAGVGHALALLTDGTVWAWGGNARGEVGIGTQTATVAPVQAVGVANAVGVAAGSFSSFALRADGSVLAWGLPNGSGTPQLLPAPIAGLSPVHALAADSNGYVAVTAGGEVFASSAGGPEMLAGLVDVRQVASAFDRQLAITGDGSAWSWAGSGSPERLSGPGLAWMAARPALSHASGTYGTALAVKISTPNAGAVIRYSIDGSDPTDQHPAIANGATVPISANTILKARAWESGRLPSGVSAATFTFKASTPVVSPSGGTFTQPPMVTMTSSPGATIRYTTTGAEPDAASPVYTGPVLVGTSHTLKAIAVREGWAQSDVATHVYQLQLGTLPPPVITPAAGTYESLVTVTIAGAVGATVHYSVDGSAPSAASMVYEGPFTVSAHTVVRARAMKPDHGDSPIAEAAYTIAAAAPVITPGGGTYHEPVEVQMASASEGATIRYTLDGSEPVVNSPAYSAAVVVGAPATVRARAFHPQLAPSPVSSVVLGFQAARPQALPRGGVVAPGTMVDLTPVVGAAVRYTLDGLPPTEASPLYTTPIGLPPGTVTLMARAFRQGWEPSAVLTERYIVDADTSAPVVTATVSPAPVAGGWHAGDAVVTFHCADADSAVTYCTPPRTASGEGRDIDVRGIGRDTVGNVGFTHAYVHIDRTAPVLSVFDPLDGDTVPAGTAAVVLRGAAWDLSGVASITCNGVPAALDGPAFTCTAPLADGANAIQVVATDLVGHTATIEAVVHAGEGPPPAGVRFTPTRLTMMIGERRPLALKDDRGRSMGAGEWFATLPGVVSIVAVDGRLQVEALAPGQTDIVATAGGFSARATIEVLGAGAAPAAGSVLWGIDSPGVPARAAIIPATPGVDDHPLEAPALFYVDESAYWFGNRLLRPTGQPVIIRATSAAGLELWVRQFNDETTIKHVTADERGGLVIVWNQWYDEVSGVFHSDRAQRLDGRTGRITWDYRPYPEAFLSEAAVHPDGRVFLTEQRIFGVSALAAITPAGDVQHWTLPGGSFSRVDNGTGALTGGSARPARATHPLIADDGTVVVIGQRGFSHQVVTSQFHPDMPTGLFVTIHADQSASYAEAMVVRLGEAGLVVNTLGGDWNEFRPEDYRLLPDGEGGLLLGHREGPHVIRFDAADRLAATRMLLQEGSGFTYGTEYVLGDGAAYVLVHGASDNGQSHWSSAVAFDPVTLASQALLPLASALPAPSHLRLQHAIAGGGIYLSGPEGTAAHLTPLSGDAAAGWSGGPALLAGAAPAAAETEWPAPGGTTQRTNVAFHPGFGLFAKSHPVAIFGRHLSLRIVPRDQDYWLTKEPALFPNVDDRGRRFATLGAGPSTANDTGTLCDGSLRLVSAFNRSADVNVQPELMERLRYARTNENSVIERLLKLDGNYADDLPYCFAPPAESQFYNSNSYIAGLLRAAHIPRPTSPGIFLVFFPGWLKPVPDVEFAGSDR